MKKPKAKFEIFQNTKKFAYPQDFDWDCEFTYTKIPLSVFNHFTEKITNPHLQTFNKVLHILKVKEYSAAGIYQADDYTYIVIIRKEIPGIINGYKIQ